MRGNSDLLSSRIREIRLDKFGAEGIAIISRAMNIPVRTWEHFENGVTIPGWILLELIEMTGVEPHWLLTGTGERYRVSPVTSSHRASR
jgi:hypothetical protein